MVFGLLTDGIEAAVNVVTDIADLEAPKKRDIAKAADTGLTIAAIAMAFGVTEDVVSAVLSEQSDS